MDADVLVVGAGPVGLMMAIELRRRGVNVLIIDKRAAPAPWAKAVGVQPRTLEIWDSVGLAREALDAAITMRGQIMYLNGNQPSRMDLELPDDVPYRFVALPQYESERVLAEHLAGLGTVPERTSQLVGFTQDENGVTATVLGSNGEKTVRTRYLVGCDGAHSVVRKGLGLSFEGDALPDEYMLADVEVNWTMPAGYGIRVTHQTDGVTDDLLVCIPLPGINRYRMSMLVPDELATPKTPRDEIAHGMEGGRAPELHHIQAVLDRLSPEPTTASRMRWSSVFRISHRLVDRYGVGRVFIAGDAAHIHPPTGAQGMNTGVQDAFNLGWKLALAVQGVAADGLLSTYHAERYPVGREVVGRTVRAAQQGIGAGATDKRTLLVREAQLLVGYPDSEIVGEHVDIDGSAANVDIDGTATGVAEWGGPRPGERAPDAAGLHDDSVAYPIRLHELLRHPDHTLLLWADSETSWAAANQLVTTVTERTSGRVRGRVIVRSDVTVPDASGITRRDSDGNAWGAYGVTELRGTGIPAHLIRPDGYVGYRTTAFDLDRFSDHLSLTLKGLGKQ